MADIDSSSDNDDCTILIKPLDITDTSPDNKDLNKAENKSEEFEKDEEKETNIMASEGDSVTPPLGRIQVAEDKTSTSSKEYRVYSIRYLMLLALVVLNLSNGMMWLSYSPVPSLTASFYDISLSDVDWFSNSYFITSLVVGIFSIIILDVLGLRTAVFCGTICNLLGSILRYISTIEPIVCSETFPKAGFTVAIIGQILTAFAQPFFLYAPAKLANTWFGSKERAVCTNLASIANPLGIAVAQIASPRIVTEVSKIPTMLWVYIIPAGIGTILSLAFIYRSSPRVPPTPSGDVPQLSFIKGLKSAAKNWNFYTLIASWGLGAGVFNAILIIIPQYLCPYGYSNKEVGLWASLLLIFGLVGATLSGILIDLTKRFKEIGVVSLSFTILSLVWFLEVATIEGQPYLIAVSLCTTGFFALSFMPVILELGIEVTYPAPEATSSGLLWSSAQIFGFVIVFIGQLISPVIPRSHLSNNQCDVSMATNSSSVCSNRPPTLVNNTIQPQYWTYSGILLIAMATVAFVIFVCLFKPKYKRYEFELNNKK